MIVNHERIGWKLLVSKASDRAQMTSDGQMRTFGGGQYAKFLEHDVSTVVSNVSRQLIKGHHGPGQ